MVSHSNSLPDSSSDFSSQNSTSSTARLLNTAFIETRGRAVQDHGTELLQLVKTPAFQAIVASVQNLSRSQGLSEKESAELIIETFRKVDKIWQDYVYSEGIKKLKGSRP